MSRVAGGGRATFFELMTAAAFELFRGVDVAVVEVGLGGRLDTTNILRPKVCVINTIDFDHMDRLGGTLAEIAREKAGIVKRGTPVVVGPQPAEALEVIRQAAQAPLVGAPLALIGTDFGVLWRRVRRERLQAEIRTIAGWWEIEMPFTGLHQAENAAVALQAAEIFEMPVEPAALRDLVLPGRFERRGRWIFDVAHNPLSARALADSLRALGLRELTIVFGASKDKDAAAMVAALAPFAKRFIFTRAKHPRAWEPEALATLARGETSRSVREAVSKARGKTLVTGSFYVVGEAMGKIRG
jgi:dihydrofolate synthase/folylpolyglutamate synthase